MTEPELEKRKFGGSKLGMKGPKRTYNEVFLPFSRFWNIGFLLKLHSHTEGDWIMERVKGAENFETRMRINHYEREWNPHPWALLGMLCFSGSYMCKTLDLDDLAKCPRCLRGEENITHWGYPGRKTTLVGIPLQYGIKKLNGTRNHCTTPILSSRVKQN